MRFAHWRTQSAGWSGIAWMPASYQSRELLTSFTTVSHHWHFDENTHDGGERGALIKAKQADRGGDRQLEEIARPNQRRRRGDAMSFASSAVQQVGQARVEIYLDEDWNRQHGDD